MSELQSLWADAGMHCQCKQCKWVVGCRQDLAWNEHGIAWTDLDRLSVWPEMDIKTVAMVSTAQH